MPWGRRIEEPMLKEEREEEMGHGYAVNEAEGEGEDTRKQGKNSSQYVHKALSISEHPRFGEVCDCDCQLVS